MAEYIAKGDNRFHELTASTNDGLLEISKNVIPESDSGTTITGFADSKQN
jgi:hypothetical protein